jgi:hypothetical protein
MGTDSCPVFPGFLEFCKTFYSLFQKEEVIPKSEIFPLSLSIGKHLVKSDKSKLFDNPLDHIKQYELPILECVRSYVDLCAQLFELKVEPPFFAEYCDFVAFPQFLSMEEILFRSVEDYIPDNRSWMTTRSDGDLFSESRDLDFGYNDYTDLSIYPDDHNDQVSDMIRETEEFLQQGSVELDLSSHEEEILPLPYTSIFDAHQKYNPYKDLSPRLQEFIRQTARSWEYSGNTTTTMVVPEVFSGSELITSSYPYERVAPSYIGKPLPSKSRLGKTRSRDDAVALSDREYNFPTSDTVSDLLDSSN